MVANKNILLTLIMAVFATGGYARFGTGNPVVVRVGNGTVAPGGQIEAYQYQYSHN